ncbi:hypothetical protein AKJ51_03190 [candidate division MSBL1 archaeon SCGC-AAA382A20]|uniref:Uncharacterized protein n=1 Tax=candidate division MSBL1 archaeon SCGC-AAA382A20 TaxID=1698280 RepID=A0A133VJS4_9EURY|nr:hypothetical protein AKJ51_03190 [candidate division MSBL1 archaeon SCGC-AAA382A20]
MKIPNSELVKRVIKQVIKKEGVIRSQEQLGKDVESELKRIDNEFQISERRARRIALEIPEVEVTIETRKSEGKRPENCPACGEELKSLYAENLENERIQVGFKCENCGYSGDVGAFTPMRYEFRYIKKD